MLIFNLLGCFRVEFLHFYHSNSIKATQAIFVTCHNCHSLLLYLKNPSCHYNCIALQLKLFLEMRTKKAFKLGGVKFLGCKSTFENCTLQKWEALKYIKITPAPSFLRIALSICLTFFLINLLK